MCIRDSYKRVYNRYAIDKRGKHTNQGKRKLPVETYEAMNAFLPLSKVESLTLVSKTKKVYLPDHLNITQLLGLFLQKYEGIEIS